MLEVQPPLKPNETVIAWITAPPRHATTELVGTIGGLSLHILAETAASAPVRAATHAVLNQAVQQVWAKEVRDMLRVSLPWRAFTCEHTLGIGFIRTAAQEAYEKARARQLVTLAEAYVGNQTWRGPRELPPSQRLETLLQTLPQLIMPEDIDCAGAWFPEGMEPQ